MVSGSFTTRNSPKPSNETTLVDAVMARPRAKAALEPIFADGNERLKVKPFQEAVRDLLNIKPEPKLPEEEGAIQL